MLTHDPGPSGPDIRRRGEGIIAAAVLDALAVVSPIDCAGCGAHDRSVCSVCRAALVPRITTATVSGGLDVCSGLAYEGVVRRLILGFKEQGRTDVARALGGALATAVRSAIRGEVELATVPSSRAAYRRRGYDPVRLLVHRAGLGRPQPVLKPVRRTARQKTLTRAERELNLVGSMVARGTLAGRRFVLLDDVVTTGSTLVEAARAIEAAGGTVVSAATLAYTPATVGRNHNDDCR